MHDILPYKAAPVLHVDPQFAFPKKQLNRAHGPKALQHFHNETSHPQTNRLRLKLL